jgi:hypothetical protein
MIIRKQIIISERSFIVGCKHFLLVKLILDVFPCLFPMLTGYSHRYDSMCIK